MNCSKPLLFEILGVNSETGKKIVRPVRFYSHLNELKETHNLVKIPCGKCFACRLNRANEWAERIMLEASLYSDNCFLTLTYNNENLPESIYDEKNGEFYNPLVKRDLQLFIKRLRKKFSDKKIRFFAVGEYGSVSNRPHFHVILFNHTFDDLEKLFYNPGSGSWCFRSPILESLWTKGISSVGELTTASAAYTARYSVKNIKYAEKEFLLMSRRPGIGKDYFDLHKDEIYMTDKLYFNFSKEKKVGKPSRYFDKLLESNNLELFNQIKEKRAVSGKIADENSLRFQNTEYSEVVYERENDSLMERTKSLKRSI